MVDFSIKELSFSYPSSDKKALSNINLDIKNGEFTVICGRSGSGKSTLLRMLKPELTPHGKIQGKIMFFGKDKKDFSQRESAEKIGYLLQNTEYQTVTHSVRSELSFGLENLGLDSNTIRLRIAEISAYFSLEGILDKKISELSGGKKQLVCLASILSMHPKTVIFDEPTSQLDPMAAEAFLSTVKKLCDENGITVIITEQRLQNIIPMADRVIVMENGRIISDSAPAEIPSSLFSSNEFINLSMPTPMRLFSSLPNNGTLPLTVADARKKLHEILAVSEPITKKNREKIKESEIAVEAKNVWFSYDKKNYILNDFNLKVPKGSFFAILGANAAGKSTALSVMSGLLPCKSGKIKIFGENIKKYSESRFYNEFAAIMPQNPESLFSCNTLGEELQKTLSSQKLKTEEKKERISDIADKAEISHLLDRHPYDLSGGEMQRAALALVLLKKPKIIFMDEPTKGMDDVFKKQYAAIIRTLCNEGITVITVSHDTEFCAKYADFCAMIFDGMCVSKAPKDEFFSNNYFYTTNANKIAREYFPDAVTEEEVLGLCIKNLRN